MHFLLRLGRLLSGFTLVLCAVQPGAVLAQAPEQTATMATPDPGYLQQEIEDLTALLEDRLPKATPLSGLFEIPLLDETAVQARVQVLSNRLAAESNTPPGNDDPEASLRRQRDRLRLELLQRPVARRAALLELQRLRDDLQRLSQEQSASASARSAAEKAREQALADARLAQDESQRWLATEEARLLAEKVELATRRESSGALRQQGLEQREQLLHRYAVVDAGVALTEPNADELYRAIRNDLHAIRKQASKALDALRAPSELPALSHALVLPQNHLVSVSSDAVARLQALDQEVRQEHQALLQAEAETRYSQAQVLMDALSIMQSRRLHLLQMISPELRDEATGFNRQGFDRVADEVAHLRLMLRWYPRLRLHQFMDASAQLDVFSGGRLGINLFLGISTFAALVILYRRRRQWLSAVHAWLGRGQDNPLLRLRADRALQIINAVSRELIFLLGVFLLFEWLIGPLENPSELAVIRAVAYAYAIYALLLALTHRVLLMAVARYRSVPATLSYKILVSLRRVARLILGIVVWLILAQALLGRGALYEFAVNLAWIGGLLLVWRLIREWRMEVTDSYLRHFPHGKLAHWVRNSQSSNRGIFIAFAAFVFVAAVGVWTWLRDLALSFEQTRKALAYFFRIRLERQARSQPTAVLNTRLPDPLEQALTEQPSPQALWVDRFPQLDSVTALGVGLAQGQSAGLVALVGERGAGKTTWLQSLEHALAPHLPCVIHTQHQRVTHNSAVLEMLRPIFGLAADTTRDNLIARIQDSPPRVVMIDLAQNLMLRTVGGTDAYEEFVRIAHATSQKILWVVAFARWPFEYLLRTHPRRDVYNQVVQLRPWSEEEIGQLIEARMAHCGFEADYDQLLLGNMPSLPRYPSAALEEAGSEVEPNADRFRRLLWDYAEGNPRIALHFWRLSLEWKSGNTVAVRLFPMPAAGALETYAEQTRFLLACLVQHENLTAAEAAAALRFPLDTCTHALRLLHDAGYLSCEEGDRYRVACHWNRAVLRFLQRKKLLVV